LDTRSIFTLSNDYLDGQMTFLPGPMARKHIYQSSQPLVDLRAACFCHRKIVDIGYVCSVCLSSMFDGYLPKIANLTVIFVSNMPDALFSVFCSALPVCPTCRTKFPLATLKRLGQGSKIVGCNAAVQHRTESSKKRNAVSPKSNGA
jgi:transcription initiation factor TFIIH subunit 3